MDAIQVLEELRSELATEFLSHYDAANHDAVEMFQIVDAAVQKKISQCAGE